MNALQKNYLRYGIQALGSILILGCGMSNGLKLVAFIALWVLTFGRFTRKESIAFVIVCTVFTVMDIGSTRNGIFMFLHPDVAGLPVYEIFLWGFFVLHTMRLLDGPIATGRRWLVIVSLLAFSAPFLIVTSSDTLLWTTSAVLLVALGFFHEKSDFVYVLYWIAFGAVWEYVGVGRGVWAYPHPPAGGVPPWFVPMWGGIGLFTRRLVYPLVYRDHGIRAH